MQLRINGAILLFILACAILMSTITGCSEMFRHVNPVPLDDIHAEFNMANYKQWNSYVQLGIINKKLYMYSGLELYVYNEGRFQTVPFNPEKQTINGIAIINEKFIYQKVSGDERGIYSYDPVTGENVYIMHKIGLEPTENYYREDGTLFIRDYYSGREYYEIADSQVTYHPNYFESYDLYGNTYTFAYIDIYIELVRYDADNNQRVYNELPSRRIALIPCEDSLIVYLPIDGKTLYMIDGESGNLTEIFSVGDCFATTSFNLHGNYLYVSIARLIKDGFKGKVKDENDALNGTYRISLTDFNSEKISEEIYNGLFIFDDTGIYASREDGIICKLDFNGNLLFELPGFKY